MNPTTSSRRHFLQTVSASALATLAPTSILAQAPASRKWTLNLVGGAIGVNVGQKEIIALAQKYGFESVEARPRELAAMETAAIQEVAASVKDAGLQWGAAGLPVDFRKDKETFKHQLRNLPKMAKALQMAGVDRVSTWIMPTHAERTYMENFELHSNRLRRVAEILKDYGQRLGMEYVGTQTLLIRDRYPFLHTLAETLELMDSIATGNVGVVLDSWHWWTSGDSLEQIQKLKGEDVILVDANDAPKGVAREDQLDNNRQLPASTGVIPIKDFLQALTAIGYDGPVRAEPFNQTLSDLGNDTACQATIDSLKKVVALLV
ncbi:sugar phosphate isomerase/epimerase [bacterium]|nr:sugar phosphate isomerase/epimerase [bacterium]